LNYGQWREKHKMTQLCFFICGYLSDALSLDDVSDMPRERENCELKKAGWKMTVKQKLVVCVDDCVSFSLCAVKPQKERPPA
jgi:hypothetical protein